MTTQHRPSRPRRPVHRTITRSSTSTTRDHPPTRDRQLPRQMPQCELVSQSAPRAPAGGRLAQPIQPIASAQRPRLSDTPRLRQSRSSSYTWRTIFSQHYERASTLVTSNLPFNERTKVFGSVRLIGVLLDRLTHHVHILEMNSESRRLPQSKRSRKRFFSA